MAKRKIIWSRRAKKKLYSILESTIRRDKNKYFAIALYQMISNGVKLLRKYPELGMKTTDNLIYGFSIESFIIYYESSDDKIVIHTISEKD